MATPQDHADACPDPCPITVDLEIRCDDGEFGDPGLRVAPAPDTTWLVTASSNAALLFRADAVDAVRLDVLPESFIRNSIGAALDPGGKLHLAADATQFSEGYADGLVHVAEVDDWSPSLVFDQPDKYVELLALEVAPDGAPHVWFESDPPDEDSLAVPDGQGGWTHAVAQTPGSDFRRYSLGAHGLPVSASMAGYPNESQVFILLDGVSRPLGDQLTGFMVNGGVHYRLSHPPFAGQLMDGPPLAAALFDDAGLHVAWPLQQDYAQIDLPDSAEPQETCQFEWNGPGSCPKDPCVEQDSGVQRGSYSLAQTADGVIWLAYVSLHVDQVKSFTEQCDDRFGCYCEATVVSDSTSGELHLVRVPVDGAPPVEVLTLPDVPLGGAQYSFSDGDFVRLIDLRAAGDQLALGARLWPSGGELAIRLLRIDTAQIAP